ncbi:MAG: HEAT repeat domain-containing protein [Candidatus Heimdallarchaeota archaeon]|nr:HEAT repeat domain-containing protein [Candidatus Heimdallarchaeota archaeon]
MTEKKLIKEQIAEVVDELRYGHPETRKAAAIKLGRIRNIEVIPYLIEAIQQDSYSFTRVSAIQSLGWIADLSAVEALIQAVDTDKDKLVRKTAINTLGAFKDRRALPVLEKVVNNGAEEEDVRNAASIAIQVINGITPDYSQK